MHLISLLLCQQLQIIEVRRCCRSVVEITSVYVESNGAAESGFGGLGVACWPLVPKFAGSNPAEAVGFLRAKKSSARLPSEGK